MPKEIVRNEIDNLRQMGVKFQTNVVIGKTITIDELFEEEGYHAVFIATGAGLPRFMAYPGEHLGGVYSANEFLTRVNLMNANDSGAFRLTGLRLPRSHRCDRRRRQYRDGRGSLALRLGARNAYIIYRRSEEEMPARKEEVHHAKDEGVQFMNLHNPVEFVGNDEGYVTAVKLIRMELGEPDESGRRRPVPLPDSEFVMPIDVAVIAIGTGANPLVQATTPDMKTNRWGYILADETTLRTTKRGVFAGGDIVSGAATVIVAMGAGRRAAASIDQYLRSGEWPAFEL